MTTRGRLYTPNMVMISLLVACAITPSASLSYSSTSFLGRSNGSSISNAEVPIGNAIATPRLQRGRSQQGASSFIPIRNYNYFASSHRNHETSTSLRMALGSNYLDNIDNEEEPDNGDNEGSNRWGLFGNGNNNNNRGGATARGTNRDGGRNSRGGGAGTAIRPSPPNGTPNANASRSSNNNNASPGNTNFGIGGNRRQQPGGGGVPKVLSIRQPQDLLDFVIQDERLSVVKVYASWCKTCAVFDIRYRKLASQLGDSYDGDKLVSKGRVRFAEMQYDDPNNEEMCRLLNATKLPYILMYKGSKGKVTDFQCGPAKFQLLIDAVNEYVDPEGSVIDATTQPATVAGGAGVGGEQEWRVVREQQQKRNQQLREEQRSAQYGGAGAISNYPPSTEGDKSKLKDEEISRLYTELSNLRKDFDKRIVSLKEEYTKENGVLNDRIRQQTKEYEDERRALSDQIKELSRQMVEREKAMQTNENAEGQRLRQDMKRTEDDYKETLTGMNQRITELEQDLFKSRNQLQYNTNANEEDQKQLREHMSRLQQEIDNLISKNQELQKELIEEKRVVVASTEEASRVLKQLEKIKYSEDEERKVLMARIEELEAEITQREKQMINVANSNGDLAAEIQLELDELKKEREQERDILSTRMQDLEQELEWERKTSNISNVAAQSSQEMEQQMQELRQESERLSSRILDLENEIDERDKLLRTSNKATDILLDNMEEQKRDYEKELDRTASLVNELGGAISNREEEMGILQERFDSLERMAGELKRREDARHDEAEAAVVAKVEAENAIRMSERAQQQGGSFEMEMEARMAAEQEVGKLMGYLQDREEEIARMRQQSSEGPQMPQFNFGALFGGGPGGNPEAEAGPGGWEENYEMLKDVLMPEEVYPREPNMPQQSGAGRYDNIREGAPRSENIWEGAGDGAGLSSLMTPDDNSGAGRYENVREGAPRNENIWGSASNTPSPSAAAGSTGQQPSPAMAFERRLAENPIVPSGTFGGSKPTASFFSPKSSSGGGVASAPSDTPEYYQNAMSNFNSEAPAMPPAASYDQRPTMPSPRGAASTGTSENIYAGAGSASSNRASPNYPSPVVREEPIAPLPTPAMAFEQRLAENPIVPSGAFGGSRPTSHFFSPKPAPSGTTAASDFSSTQQSSFPQQPDASQAKWQGLDENEKKRVAAEAYKAFEKSLEDSRRTQISKPTKNVSTMGSRGGGGGGSDRVNKRPSTADAKNQSQMEIERKKHQDMVNSAAAKGQAEAQPSATRTTTKAPVKKQQQTSQQVKASAVPRSTIKAPAKKQQQSAQQIQASAAQASAKRMSLAERAAKAEQDRKDSAKRMKAEARNSQEEKHNESLKRDLEAKRQVEIQRAEELKRKADADLAAAAEAKAKADGDQEAKRQVEIQRAEELKRKADADLAAAAEAKAKADAEAAKQSSVEFERLAAKHKAKMDAEEVAAAAAAAAKQERSEQLREQTGSLETKERIEAALLGAEESDYSGRAAPQEEEQQPTAEVKQQKPDQTGKAEKAKTRVKAGGFAVSKYDVVVMKDPKNDIDMPQILLEGSLKDLLKDGPPPNRRNSSKRDSNY